MIGAIDEDGARSQTFLEGGEMLASAELTTTASDRGAGPRRIGRVAVSPLTARDMLALANDAVARGGHLKLAFANAHVVNLAARDAAFSHALASCLVLPDGVGVDVGSRLLHGAPFPENLNGTDFTPALLRGLDRPCSVALIGARPGVAERAAARFAELAPAHRYAVVSHGFFGDAEEAGILARLAAERPDVVLVAFGNPRQETWIADRIDASHCSLALGVGALFDFMAGEVARAPGLVRRLRMEWVWRLAQEPGRLWRRYVLGNPAFLARVAWQKMRGRA